MSKTKKATKTASKNVAVEATEQIAPTTTVETPAAEPQIKVTPLELRQYEPTERVERSYKGKQRQIVYGVLMSSEVPLTISQVAEAAEKLGLSAIGGVEPSVRYHLHHLTKAGDTVVVNPTFILE